MVPVYFDVEPRLTLTSSSEREAKAADAPEAASREMAFED
jgi:hypothetical protein